MSSADRDSIDETLARFLDGEPEPSDGALLAEAMRSDERFAREVARLLEVDDLIRQGAEPDDRAFLEALKLRLSTEHGGGAFLQELERRVRRGTSVPRRPWLAWTLAAAVVVAIALIVLFWPKGRGGPPIEAEAPPRVVLPAAAPGEDFAVVVQLLRAEWEEGAGLNLSEGDLLSARRLSLRSGQVTLAFLSGVTLTLEGPADLELISIDRVFCHRGKLRARVPDGAEGFVVAAPGSAVIDRGTEFGLNVQADGKARVMVFEGDAEAAVLDASGSQLRYRGVAEHRALEIDPLRSQIEDDVARSESFVPPPVLATPPLALDPSYRDAVLEARPRGYWRFESMDGGAVVNEVAGGPALSATGPIRLAGNGNRWAAFGTGGAEQRLMMDGLWAPPRDPGYAVELWFLPERIGHAALAGLILPRAAGDYNHLFLLELTVRDRQSLFPPAAVRFLNRWPPELWGGDNLFSSKHYLPNRWHHVVAQTKGNQMELYLDGAALPPLSLSSDRGTEACQFLVGRLKPLPRSAGDAETRPFIGQLDELALYDHPLTVEEVRRHHELGAPGARPSGR